MAEFADMSFESSFVRRWQGPVEVAFECEHSQIPFDAFATCRSAILTPLARGWLFSSL
jgi:hypothetical protein